MSEWLMKLSLTEPRLKIGNQHNDFHPGLAVSHLSKTCFGVCNCRLFNRFRKWEDSEQPKEILWFGEPLSSDKLLFRVMAHLQGYWRLLESGLPWEQQKLTTDPPEAQEYKKQSSKPAAFKKLGILSVCSTIMFLTLVKIVLNRILFLKVERLILFKTNKTSSVCWCLNGQAWVVWKVHLCGAPALPRMPSK